jgi:arylsulfatase A-like enzyme
LLGETDHGRDVLVEQGSGPMTLAIRQGNWKLIPRFPGVKDTRLPLKTSLFDLSTDIGEEKNIAADHPDKVAELSKLLQKIRDQMPTTKP